MPNVGVATVTFLAPVAAPAVIAQLAFTLVAVEVTTLQVTPPPDIVTAVAPARLVPVMVTGTVVPRAPEVGLIAVSVGPCTVNVTLLLVPPGVVVMLTFLADTVAVSEIVNVAFTVVGFTTVRPLTVTPPPATVIAVAPVRLVPVRVTGTAVPRKPVLGAIEASVGPITVNVTVLLVPPGVVTLTFLAVIAAVFEIAKFAVT